ncbi:MAG: RNA-directed DNA polymerase [Nostoc sp.]|uniref:RNA-directed DNA polymerase n=1 Tax=Nostoc sp. TaxID=1180 RepID=UPI002FF4463A
MNTSTSIYDSFISLDNLKLAWERVRYFDRSDSRDWIGLKVFAANRDHNLELLRQTLTGRTFEASYPEIKYLPKASQTLRPMAILAVSDRVVYQAIANVVAEKARPILSTAANRQSFANVLSAPVQKPMFMPWKIQYRLFQKKFQTLYEEGNVWLAETDMAAFYETIDQTMLIKYLREQQLVDDLTAEHLRTYLPIWASVKGGETINRGLPQGCLASDFFANLFLYGFDRELSVQEYHYIRYVDDIRLLARTREAVQQGLIRIDRTLKTLGLLIQTTKTTVRQISNFAEEADRMASKLSEVDRRFRELNEIPDTTLPDSLAEPSLHDVALLGEDCEIGNRSLDLLIATSGLQEDLLELFWQSKKSIDAGGNNPFAERHLKFCLYRLDPNPAIVTAILPYLLDKPWLTQSLHQYLRKCELDKDALEFLDKNIIAIHSVYDSTVTFAIETLMRQNFSLRYHHGLFRKWLTDNKRDWPLLCAAVMALGDNQENMSVLLNVISSSSYSPSVRRTAIIQALRLAIDEHEALCILKQSIYDKSPIVIDTLLYQLYVEHGLTIKKLGLDETQQLSEYLRNSARGYDNSLPHLQPCYIRYIFTRFYRVNFSQSVDFHALLGLAYQRATDFLWQSDKSYLSNASRYASQLDLFHEELLYPILVEKLKLKPSREDVAKMSLPSRMQHIHSQEQKLRIFASGLLKCHDLRSSSIEAHTRLDKILDPTNPVSWHERDALKKQLCGAYQELVDWLLQNK